VFVFSNLAALLSYAATMAPSFLLSLYLQYVKGLSPEAAGLVMVSQPLVQAIFSPLAGRLSDRIEPRIVASLGMMVTAVGLALFIFLDASTPMAFVVANLMLLGFGFALFSSPNTNAIMGSVERRLYGVASATMATMRMSGQMISMSIATLIIGMYVGHVELAPANYPLLVQGTRVAFVAFAALCAAGVLASLSRGDVQPEAVAAK
jgi:MFS family permease